MFRSGYTAIELMVTILVVGVLATSMGASVAKLLSLQEAEREEGYIRESLVDLCALCADFSSVGSSFCVSNQDFVVKYRQETGGVSLETGRVTRAVYLKTSNVASNSFWRKMIDLDILGGLFEKKYSRGVMGSAALIPFKGNIDIKSSITPIGTTPPVPSNETDTNLVGYVSANTALGYLRITAEYEIKSDEGLIVTNAVTAGRVVRLWNRE